MTVTILLSGIPRHFLDSQSMHRFDRSDLTDHPIDRCSQCRLKNLSLLEGISFLGILDLQLHKRAREFEGHIELFTQDADADRIVFIESGRVILRYLTEDFRFVTSKIAHPGDVLGLFSAWHEEPYSTTATTVTPVRVAELSANDLHSIAGRHADLQRAVKESLATAHQTTGRKERSWTAIVAAAILEVDHRTARDIHIEELSHRLSSIRPKQVTTALDLLEQRGAILIRTPHLIIINTNTLERSATKQEECFE